MSRERLEHIATILEVDGSLPPASACWLKGALRKFLDNDEPMESAFCIAKRDQISERDAIVISGVSQVEGLPTKRKKALFLASEARKIHRGRKTSHPFIAKADRIAALPESPRRYEQILR